MNDIHVYATGDQWKLMREDPSFVELTRLARAANSLVLIQYPLKLPLSDQRPSTHRDRFVAVMYAAALLKEALIAARTLGKWYRNESVYQKGLGALLSDPAVQALELQFLNRVRNELVFHFDRDAVLAGIQALPEGETVLAAYAEEDGPTFGATYFTLADSAVLGYLFTADTHSEALHLLEGFIEDVTSLVTRFLAASHNLIVFGMVQRGCARKRVARAVEGD